jgi:hypothetical protein
MKRQSESLINFPQDDESRTDPTARGLEGSVAEGVAATRKPVSNPDKSYNNSITTIL